MLLEATAFCSHRKGFLNQEKSQLICPFTIKSTYQNLSKAIKATTRRILKASQKQKSIGGFTNLKLTPGTKYLWHPGTDNTFSGYGFPIDREDDHLVGLLMIDRP